MSSVRALRSRYSDASHCLDAGSAYHKAYRNFFLYAAHGLRRDLNGHDTQAYENVYAYVSDCWGPAGKMWLKTGANNTFRDNACIANSDEGGFASDCAGATPVNLTITRNRVFNRCGTLKVKLCDASNAATSRRRSAPQTTATIGGRATPTLKHEKGTRPPEGERT